MCRTPTLSIVLLVSGVAVAVGTSALAQEKYPFNERPASVRIDITNSPKRYNGSFKLAGTARVCGEVPAMLNFAGVPAFSVEFGPDPATGKESVSNVTFGSTELVGKVTTTGSFKLNVTVQSPTIGRPPAYVLDTARKGNGKATLTTTPKGETVLRVVGGNDMGESIDMTLTCGPRR